MSITKLDKALPINDKIEDNNDMIIELDGKTSQAKFDKYEIDALYSGSGLQRKFIRETSLSSTTGANAWYRWKHIKAESGYSIWKFDSDLNYIYNSKNEMYFDNRLVTNKGNATAESITSFDNVFTYDGSYTDNTTEASSEGGITFDLLTATSDYVYIGNSTTFAGIRFKFGTRGRNHTLKIEYSNGSTWTTLSALNNDLVDNTSNFRRDGSITFTVPSNWNKDTVNSANVYWIRISTTIIPTTTAKAYAVLPYNSVATLLALSSSQVTNDKWAFCSYNITGTGARLYATFRNIGGSSYEGDFYIASTSSVANKENFFRANHAIQVSYQDSDYSFTGSNINVREIKTVDLNVSGNTTFSVFPITPSTAPDADYEVANKKYVDDNATGETNTASNVGTTGSGIFKQKAGVDLEFYKLNSTNGILIVTLDGTNKIDFTVVEGNIDHNQLTNYAANQHFLQTSIENLSITLGTGLLKIVTGSGLLSTIGDSSSNWDNAYTHISNDGSDHSYIDQNLTTGSSPFFYGTPTVGKLKIKQEVYFDAEYDNGNSGASDNIDWRNSNKQKITLTDDCTFTFTDPSGTCNLVLKLIQDATGNRTITWPGSIKWESGAEPNLSTGANAIDIVSSYFDGTSYYGVSALNFS